MIRVVGEREVARQIDLDPVPLADRDGRKDVQEFVEDLSRGLRRLHGLNPLNPRNPRLIHSSQKMRAGRSVPGEVKTARFAAAALETSSPHRGLP